MTGKTDQSPLSHLKSFILEILFISCVSVFQNPCSYYRNANRIEQCIMIASEVFQVAVILASYMALYCRLNAIMIVSIYMSK